MYNNLYNINIMFGFPHPLVNLGAGRYKSDPINEERIQLVLSRVQQKEIKKGNLNYTNYPISLEKVQMSKIMYPGAFFSIGVVSSFAFVHKNSKYIGKIFTLGMTVAGYVFAKQYEYAYNCYRYFYNYPDMPKDVQKMIDNNDARYAHRWLQDDYLKD